MSDFVDTNEWVPIHTLPGFQQCIEYHVSRDGRVKSTKGGKEKILKGAVIRNGYRKVTLQQRLGQGGELQPYVHTLVALAFIGEPPTPMGRKKGCSVIDHKDENKLNNHADNLHWVSVSDNINKHPYKKYQAIERTEDDLLVDACRKTYFAKMRMRRFRAKKKSLKIEESND